MKSPREPFHKKQVFPERSYIKAVIFDVDGVLVDSKKANVATIQKILETAGYPKPSAEDILKCFHLTLWHAIEKLTGVVDQKEIERIWKYGQDPSVRHPHLFEFPPSIEKILTNLHKKYRLAIVTGRIKWGVDDVFSVSNIKHLFDVVVTFDDYKNPKPHPEPLQIALKRLNLNPNEAIYIGDSPTDIEAALAAGMPSVYLSNNKHQDAGINIDQFSKIEQAVEQISRN